MMNDGGRGRFFCLCLGVVFFATFSDLCQTPFVFVFVLLEAILVLVSLSGLFRATMNVPKPWRATVVASGRFRGTSVVLGVKGEILGMLDGHLFEFGEIYLI